MPVNVGQLAKQALAKAKSSKVMIVTAESCTAGALSTALSKAPGASDYLHGGFVTYTKEMKSVVLGVSPYLLRAKSAVCAEVARAMARGALHRSTADIAIAVTGVAGPEPDEDANPVGLVFCAVARSRRRETRVKKFRFRSRGRDQVVRRAVIEALRLLIKSY